MCFQLGQHSTNRPVHIHRPQALQTPLCQLRCPASLDVGCILVPSRPLLSLHLLLVMTLLPLYLVLSVHAQYSVNLPFCICICMCMFVCVLVWVCPLVLLSFPWIPPDLFCGTLSPNLWRSTNVGIVVFGSCPCFLSAHCNLYYLRFKNKVTLLPAEPFPSWPGMVWPIQFLE